MLGEWIGRGKAKVARPMAPDLESEAAARERSSKESMMTAAATTCSPIKPEQKLRCCQGATDA